MHPFVVHVFAVVGCYYVWRAYAWWLRRRERQLRDRVAYLLWVAAQRMTA